MKKETAILAILIAFLAGFITGAIVAILRGTKETEKVAGGPPPQMSQLPQQELDLTAVNLRINALKDIVKKDPKNLSALEELGNLYFDIGQPKESIEAYTQYLALKPENANVRTDMGIMYRTMGEFDRAIEEFKKAAQSDPKHVNSRYNIGIVLLHDKNDLKGAIKAWEEYLKVDPNSERANRLRAQLDRMKQMADKMPPPKPPSTQ
jgi:tetratricopeptide (TPR) repeat protein